MRGLGIGVLAALFVLALCGCNVMKRISEGAYRNAVADGTVEELGKRGVRLERRPSCTMPPTGSESVLRVRCTGRTTTGAEVVVTGVATNNDTAHPREDYVVTVGGRELLRANCLGPKCR
jgi:hypothetical protein